MKTDTLQSTIHEISYKPQKRLQLFKSLTLDKQVDILSKLSKHTKTDIISRLDTDELRVIIEKLDVVEATDLVQLLPKKKRENIINSLNEFLKNDISLLLNFDPETAAGLMNLDYVLVGVEDTIIKVGQKVQVHEQRTGKIPTILVLGNDTLIGYLPGHKLAYTSPQEIVGPHIKKIDTLNYNANQNEVLGFFRKHPHSKVVVLGEHNNVLGVIYSDDIIKLLHEQTSSSLYDFAGVKDEESIYDSVKNKVHSRYKWLIINLGTAFLAAFVVRIFEDVISAQVLLAVYMPIVAGMGGNAGTQTLAIMVRGLAQHDVGSREILYILKNEVGAGFINGVINGLIVFLIVMLFNNNYLVAITLGIAMVTNLLIASTAGTLIPVLMKRLGKDPASSATIFITTATDVFGFLAFLGLATLLL